MGVKRLKELNKKIRNTKRQIEKLESKDKYA